MLTSSGEGLLQGLLDSRFVFADLRGPGMEEALGELARRLAAAGVIRDVQDLTHRLIERERLGCTSLGGGVAIPHCKSRDVDDVVQEGVDLFIVAADRCVSAITGGNSAGCSGSTARRKTC